MQKEMGVENIDFRINIYQCTLTPESDVFASFLHHVHWAKIFDKYFLTVHWLSVICFKTVPAQPSMQAL